MDKYIDNTSDLELKSKFTIILKQKEDKKDIRVRRQNIRIYILFSIVFLLIYIILKEYVYDHVIIKRGGLNYFTLCENIPYDCH